jgi:hypothetical protein
MDRYLQSTAATLSVTFSVDGTGTNPSPDSATVTVTRADGTAVVTNAAATDAGTGVFTYTLTPAQTAQLDQLTVAWTATLNGVAQTLTTRAEIVGGFLFSIADARAVKPLENTTTFTTAKIVAARTLAEQALEDACGVAFVPRYTRETLTGYGATTLVARWPRVRTVRSATVDDTALTVGELADLKVLPSGEIYNPGRWTNGFASTVVAYEHGYDSPPLRVSRACLLLAKNWLVDGPIDDRATSLSTDDGIVTLATPGLRGSTFGIPEVEAVVQEYGGFRVGVA